MGEPLKLSVKAIPYINYAVQEVLQANNEGLPIPFTAVVNSIEPHDHGDNELSRSYYYRW